MGSDGSSRDGSSRDGTDSETDAVGGDILPRTPAAGRLSRPGAVLPGRTIGESFIRALSLGAKLGAGIGLVAGALFGVALDLEEPGGNTVGIAIAGAFAGVLIGVLVGLVCGCSAALGVLAGVGVGATGRWAKAIAGAVGALLGVLAIAGVAEGNGRPWITAVLSSGSLVGGLGALVALAAVAAAALSISVLDSDSRRLAAVRASTERPGAAASAAPMASPGAEAAPAAAVRRGPPPIPGRVSGDADLTPTPGGVALLTTCILAVTLLSGMALLGMVTDARDAYAEQQQWLWPTEPTELHETVPPVAGAAPNPEADPSEPGTQLNASEVHIGMQAVLDAAVTAAGPAAVWTVSHGDGTRGALGEAPAEEPAEAPVVSFEACAEGAGVSTIYPDVSFTTGVITDTTSDEHDREVTDSNVAASERIVAAWEALGYNEDSDLGGNIDLAGSAALPAKSLHVRYSFGLVTLVRVGPCLPGG
ncbi:hypothetical protein GCM10022381_19290 [Leifsonia kafniensis]|uniref:PASTA domain-containing protein n=1 Tax=Leifsonia kafniensis TaxID=475957 RepID=A0ABP7KGU2_9MICO